VRMLHNPLFSMRIVTTWSKEDPVTVAVPGVDACPS